MRRRHRGAVPVAYWEEEVVDLTGGREEMPRLLPVEDDGSVIDLTGFLSDGGSWEEEEEEEEDGCVICLLDASDDESSVGVVEGGASGGSPDGKDGPRGGREGGKKRGRGGGRGRKKKPRAGGTKAKTRALPRRNPERAAARPVVWRGDRNAVPGRLKRRNFADARRLERGLRRELGKLRPRAERGSGRRLEEEEEERELRARIEAARGRAADEIYWRNNSAGDMGMEDCEGRAQVDFHGLYLREAIQRYEDTVLPVLPVQRQCAIITGRGAHSGKKGGVLREGLMEHIRSSVEFREGKLKCGSDSCQGRLLIRYTNNP